MPIWNTDVRHKRQSSAFVSELMTEVQLRLGIVWLYTPPETPQANGKLERRHRVLKATLRGFCSEKQDQWEGYIDTFCFAVNNAKTLSLCNQSPAFLVYGRDLKAPWERILEDPKWKTQEDEWTYRARVKEQALKELENKFYQDQIHRDRIRPPVGLVEYKVGDLVMVYSQSIPKGASSKLSTYWTGPWEIVERVTAHSYKVRKGDSVLLRGVRNLLKYLPFMSYAERERKDKCEIPMERPRLRVIPTTEPISPTPSKAAR